MKLLTKYLTQTKKFTILEKIETAEKLKKIPDKKKK